MVKASAGACAFPLGFSNCNEVFLSVSGTCLCLLQSVMVKFAPYAVLAHYAWIWFKAFHLKLT